MSPPPSVPPTARSTGLSIPTALSNGLWVLLADTSVWDETFPQTVPAGVSPLLYFMETLRFLPPVGTFPFWSGDNTGDTGNSTNNRMRASCGLFQL